MFDLSNITKYIIPSATNHILAALERYNPNKEDIDIANVYILFDGNSVLRQLMINGYRLVNSKDKFVNDILQQEEVVIPPLTKIENSLNDFDDIKTTLVNLKTNLTYECDRSDLFPLVLLSFIYRPSVDWFVIDREKFDFIKYCKNMLYVVKGHPSIDMFEELIKDERSLRLVKYNNLYKIDNPYTHIEQKVKLPFMYMEDSWSNIFFTQTILPDSLGRIVHSKEARYRKVVENIGYNLLLGNKHRNITLDNFIRGK